MSDLDIIQCDHLGHASRTKCPWSRSWGYREIAVTTLVNAQPRELATLIDNVIASVHVKGFPGDESCSVVCKKRSCNANVIDADEAGGQGPCSSLSRAVRRILEFQKRHAWLVDRERSRGPGSLLARIRLLSSAQLGLGASPGNRLIVGNADDEALLRCQ
jgi:hypothetical protein